MDPTTGSSDRTRDYCFNRAETPLAGARQLRQHSVLFSRSHLKIERDVKKVIKELQKIACRTIVVDGTYLQIVAVYIREAEWQLYVENELGIRTNWTESFATAEAALTHGTQAIETEGIAPFVEIEGFEYLLDS